MGQWPTIPDSPWGAYENHTALQWKRKNPARKKTPIPGFFKNLVTGRTTSESGYNSCATPSVDHLKPPSTQQLLLQERDYRRTSLKLQTECAQENPNPQRNHSITESSSGIRVGIPQLPLQQSSFFTMQHHTGAV